MLSFDVEFSVFCECGEDLTYAASADSNDKGHDVTVPPCPACMEDAREAGREEGNDDSFQEGYDAGYIDGCKEALNDRDDEDSE